MTDAMARVWAGAIYNGAKTWDQVPIESLSQVIHGSVYRGWADEEVVKGNLTLEQFTTEDRAIVEQALINTGHGNLVPGYVEPDPPLPPDVSENQDE